jgi:hypothetical protein
MDPFALAFVLLPWVLLGIALRYGPLPIPVIHKEERWFGMALWVGALSFAAGFFGPMVLAPGANQGPLLGIFITGPVGTLVGAFWGLWRERQRAA